MQNNLFNGIPNKKIPPLFRNERQLSTVYPEWILLFLINFLLRFAFGSWRKRRNFHIFNSPLLIMRQFRGVVFLEFIVFLKSFKQFYHSSIYRISISRLNVGKSLSLTHTSQGENDVGGADTS